MEPVPLKNRLAEQPNNPPRFSVSLKDLEIGKEFLLADPKATRALLACMDMSAALGGAASHWGGPSAFAEILSALFGLVFFQAEKEQVPWFERFHLINDAGHCENGIYALKANYGMAGLTIKDLKKFRSIESRLTGHGEAHLFPEAVYLSNGPLGSTLGQAQGLALADRLQGHKRMSVVTISDGALMEGEVKEALSAIPGFAAKNKMNPFLLIVSDNNTKLSGRIDQDSFSMEPTMKSLETLSWDVLELNEGNNLPLVFKSLKQAMQKAWQNPLKPVALWAKTCKGFGIKATEESPSGGHGFPLKNPQDLKDFIEEIYAGRKIPSEIRAWCEELSQIEPEKKPSLKQNKKKVQEGVSRALLELKKKGRPLVSISSDLPGSTGVAPFRKAFPACSFDMGVAEANMISVAAGFSKAGFIPIVDTFAQFAVTKGALPLIMSVLSEAPVIGIFSHAGFQDAADGASHQALSYFAKTCSLPHTQVYSLSCAEEAFSLVSGVIEDFFQQRKSGNTPLSSLFFLGRETFPPSLPRIPEAEAYSLKNAQVLFDNSKGKNPVLVVSSGPLVHQALAAAEELGEQNQGCVLINNPLVSDPDADTLSHWLKVCQGRLLTVEEHQLRAGFGSLLLMALARKGFSPKYFQALAVDGSVGRSAYKAVELYKMFGLDKEAITKAILKLAQFS